MGSNSRYDRARLVGDREAAEARAIHLIGELVGNYPGISNPDVAGQIAHVLHDRSPRSTHAASCTWPATTTPPTNTPRSAPGSPATRGSRCTSPRPPGPGSTWSR